jgi:hypothetical protein
MLALEAAARRTGKESGTVRLAAVQRVTRAQRFPDGWAAHFSLFAMVTAGRDEGNRRFEEAELAGQLGFATAAFLAAGLPMQIALTPLSDAGERIAAGVSAEMAAQLAAAPAAAPAGIVTDPDRVSGRGYYRDLCFKVNALVDGSPTEIGDGGFTDWTARLLSNGKERLLISGYGTERLGGVIGGGQAPRLPSVSRRLRRP